MLSKGLSLPALLLCTVVASSASASAPYLQVYGGPTYDSTTGNGYQGFGGLPGNGVGVGSATKYVGGVAGSLHAVRWDTLGNTTELGNLGTDSVGRTNSFVNAVTPSGAAFGFAEKYSGNAFMGDRAVRWDPSGTSATELANLSTGVGIGFSQAFAANNVGIAVGSADLFSGSTDLGARAVRWDVPGTTVTELGNLGTDTSGKTNNNRALAVNAAGTAVGSAHRFSGDTDLGPRAVRWDSSGTTATELDSLGTEGGGITSSEAKAVNDSGTAVGYAYKFNGNSGLGQRAVRWDASGTAATELGNLGTHPSGTTYCDAFAINAAGTAVGDAQTYSGSTDLGPRAVRWDASSTTAIELGNLNPGSSGTSVSEAIAINTAGIAVGYDAAGTVSDYRAVIWKPDGSVVDLNTLIDPNSGWTLGGANSITDTNWVAGGGYFDPNGPGPLSAYPRAFLLNISAAVPEPGSIAVLCLAGMPLGRRRCSGSGGGGVDEDACGSSCGDGQRRGAAFRTSLWRGAKIVSAKETPRPIADGR